MLEALVKNIKSNDNPIGEIIVVKKSPATWSAFERTSSLFKIIFLEDNEINSKLTSNEVISSPYSVYDKVEYPDGEIKEINRYQSCKVISSQTTSSGKGNTISNPVVTSDLTEEIT